MIGRLRRRKARAITPCRLTTFSPILDVRHGGVRTPSMRLALVLAALVVVSPALAEKVYVGPNDRHQPSVAIVLHRGDMKGWTAKAEQVDAFCFYRAASVAHVDGHWWAINGISRGGVGKRWIENSGRREALEDEDKAP